MTSLYDLCTRLTDRLEHNIKYDDSEQDFDLDYALVEEARAFLADPHGEIA